MKILAFYLDTSVQVISCFIVMNIWSKLYFNVESREAHYDSQSQKTPPSVSSLKVLLSETFNYHYAQSCTIDACAHFIYSLSQDFILYRNMLNNTGISKEVAKSKGDFGTKQRVLFVQMFSAISNSELMKAQLFQNSC